MSIQFKSVARKNPNDRQAPEKHYPLAVVKDRLDLNELADLVADGSTVRRNDIYAVLIGLVDVAKRELASGNLVKLGDLGSFTVNVSGEGQEKPEDVIATTITKGKIIFRPALAMRKMLKTLSYEKIE